MTGTYMDAVKATTPSPGVEIPTELSLLGDATARLDEALGALEGRLAPILRNVPPNDGARLAEGNTSQSAVASNIHVAQLRIGNICSRVSDLLDRLDI